MDDPILVVLLVFAVFSLMIAALYVLAARRLQRDAGTAPTEPATQTAPRCRDCVHWDLDEGQAIMRQHRPFLAAAAVLTPSEMGRTIQYEPVPCDQPSCEKTPDSACTKCWGTGTYNRRIGPEPTTVSAKTQWSEFGACSVQQEIRHQADSCSSFERRKEPAA